MLHIGVDEVGYGPLLGPLVIGLAAFRVEDTALSTAGDSLTGDSLAGGSRAGGRAVGDARIRRRLKGYVCRVSRSARTPALPVPIDDSKRVLQRHGIDGLARGVGAFSAALDQAPPAHLEDLIDRYSDCRPEDFSRAPWFERLDTVAVPTYPWTGPLEDKWAARGVRALDLRVLPVDAPALNESFHALQNKANVLGLLSATLLLSVLDRYPGEDAHVVMDRHGGRLDYSAYLAQVFPFAQVARRPAPRGESAYRVDLPDRCLWIRFVTKGDQISLAVSWASMAAKLTRELFMRRFNAWFAERCPGVKPTAGYVTDGRRFLEDVQDFLCQEAIERHLLVRTR